MATGKSILNDTWETLWFAEYKYKSIYGTFKNALWLPTPRNKVLVCTETSRRNCTGRNVNHWHPWKSNNLWILHWGPNAMTCKEEHIYWQTEKQAPCLPDKSKPAASICPSVKKIMKMWGIHAPESALLMKVFKVKYFLTEISFTIDIHLSVGTLDDCV